LIEINMFHNLLPVFLLWCHPLHFDMVPPHSAVMFQCIFS